MSIAIRLFSAAMLLLVPGVFVGEAAAQTGAADCEGRSALVKAASSGVRTTTVNFNTDEMGVPDAVGHFDAVPLISTTITTTGRRNCVVVHFSAVVEPQDNHVMFQVRVDGVPMQGHAIFPYSVPTVQAPVVWDPEETDKNLTRMVAYSFFAEVGGGTHSVEVLFAGCCGMTFGTNVISLVRNSVVTLEY
jgi:hypothetical protein